MHLTRVKQGKVFMLSVYVCVLDNLEVIPNEFPLIILLGISPSAMQFLPLG